jgi:soluble lytic murein transglycosylase
MGQQSSQVSKGGGSYGLVLAVAVVIGGLGGLAIGLQPWAGDAGDRIAAVTPEDPKPVPSAKPNVAPAPISAPVETRGPAPSAQIDIRPLPQAPLNRVAPAAAGTAAQNVPAVPVRKLPPLGNEPKIASLESPSAPLQASGPAQQEPTFDRVAIRDVLNRIERVRVSEQDIGVLKEAVRRFYKDDFSTGKPLIDKIEDPTARLIARWYYLRSSKGHAPLAQYAAFRRDHPMWPSEKLLRRNAELSALLKKPQHEEVLAFFRDQPPVTGAGKAALGAAYLDKGEKARGTALIREAWHQHALPEDAQEAVRERFDKLLRREDHKARADWLLAQDRRNLTDDARRLKKELAKPDQKSMQARVAEVRRSRHAGGLLTRLDSKLKARPEVLLSRVRWLRRHGNNEKAWRLLQRVPGAKGPLVAPAAWWEERRIHVRAALNAGRAETAYAIARDHGGAEGEELHEAEFLAGWIALRFLDKPEAARTHFAASRAGADLPADFARSDYWLGRAELKLGDTAAAQRSFTEAGRHFHTYYGQLARLALGERGKPISFRQPAAPTRAEMDRFAARDVVRAIPISRQAGFDAFIALFVLELSRDIEAPGEMTLAAELAKRVAPPNVVVRFGKVALNRGFPVEVYAFPTDIPEFKMLSGARPVERALMMALARQESEFNPAAKSRAGARGLMQLMPATARMMARVNKIPYRRSSLTDPAYNAKLGTSYMRRLLDRFDESYIMMLAGYNAGPGRVGQWIELFGDPRKPSVDPVDWVERIPFTETRIYVHKIMESLQVYRAILNGGDAGDITLATDLHRGRAAASPDPIYAGAGIN